jgi:succinate-semialdehyde dehydrogenase/glutarate-semialdehyde dehydrogenase
VRLGGKAVDGPGFFYPPTVIANVGPGSDILDTEVFGPVAAVIPFDHPDDAIRLANATEFGLAAYVYSNDLKAALQLADRIECGMVAVNRGLVSDAAAPFGGVKQSGLGREGGHHGLLEYCEAKYIAVSW